jgi:hypothetical protein
LEACGPTQRRATFLDWTAWDNLCLTDSRFHLAVVFRSWREGEPPIQVWMGAEGWDRTVAGQAVVVPVHPGALGVEWYEPRRVAPSGPAGR